MPGTSRKRRPPNTQKSQLLFVEQPRSGSKHDYGPHLRSALNPRPFLSEQSRQSGPVNTWVCSQFTSLEDTAVHPVGQSKRRKKNQLHTSSLNRTVNAIQIRKTTVCKYPALLFDTSNPVPLRCHRSHGKNTAMSHVRDSPERQQPHQSPNGGTTSPANCHDDTPRPTSLNIRGSDVNLSRAEPTGFAARTTQSGLTTRTSTPDVLTPPHIESPEITHCEHSAPSSVISLLFSPNRTAKTETFLVRDTPEGDYGLKVTWRRRKKLLRLLTERGQLLDTEAMVSNQWAESSAIYTNQPQH